MKVEEAEKWQTIPFGYRRAGDGRIEIDPVQAKTVRDLFAGDTGAIAGLVRRPIYMGVVTYPEGTSVECPDLAIVDRDTFVAAARRVRESGRDDPAR